MHLDLGESCSKSVNGSICFVFFTFANNSTLPFNQNFFVLLNLAMGGTFGGTIDAAFNNATFEVDYVRVYQ